MPDSTPPRALLLRVTGIDKSFPGVHALQIVDFEVRAGEVVALLGENGAGKSTLIKILAGAYRPDGGTMDLVRTPVADAPGSPYAPNSPVEARRAGIAVIYQEFNLVPTLTAAENIFLGSEQTRLGILNHGEEDRRARTLFARLGAAIDPQALCRDLSIAQQQIVAPHSRPRKSSACSASFAS
jgi:ABC-type sugar transport system ATPase subunit